MAELKTINKENPFDFSDGNLRLNFKVGVSCVKQTVDTRIKTFKTEFYYNKSVGVDWFGVVLNSASQPIEREAELNDTVSGTIGVNALISSELLINRTDRSEYYTAKAVSDGQIFNTVQEISDNG